MPPPLPTIGRTTRAHYPINEIRRFVIEPENRDGSWERVGAHLAASSDNALTD